MRLTPLGDSAVTIFVDEAGQEALALRVGAIVSAIRSHPPKGALEVVAAFASAAVFYDLAAIESFESFCVELEGLCRVAVPSESSAVRELELPVCYDGEFGPDLAEVAARHNLTCDEVIRLHATPKYFVQAVGFAPGFPYLAGLNPRLATPRRPTPRTSVAPGSVGIGGSQTGVYPLATPGGWNLIGRTPLRLFDPARTPPALLRAGDRVQFRRIAPDEFAKLAEAPTGHESAARPMPETGRAVELVRAGMFTTVQDLGRAGHRSAGVGTSGAADAFALRVANMLVGNRDNAAALEFTLVGPELRFSHDTVVALGGAECPGLDSWRPTLLPSGDTLKLGAVRNGCRGYLAIAGGILTAPVLGSRSTHVRAALGGLHGRALRDADRLPLGLASPQVAAHWHVDPRLRPPYSLEPEVRFVAGAEYAEFDGWRGQSFVVTPQSDRMGMRLRGDSIRRRSNTELLSAPVVPGTIQVPPDGQPIVLGPDAQTIGGYPQFGHVISLDLPLVAQLRPGDRVRFREVTVGEAHAHARVFVRGLGLLREGLATKIVSAKD